VTTTVRAGRERSPSAPEHQASITPDQSEYTKAILNILNDAGEEQQKQGANQRAMLNILEDLATEKSRLESTQKALINMLDAERRTVDRTNVELREVNEAMRSFIATAAHDLRSPLASMVGFSSLLTKNWATLSDEKRQQFATTIDRQSHKLTWLVNDLLTLSSIEGGVLNTQPELVVVNDAITASLAASGQDRASVTVSCPPDLVVRADPSHLSRIIDNYIQNAFKYGEPPICIEAYKLGEMVEIRVIDHGAGVPEEFTTKLFQRFARGDDPSTRRKKGTGLGLSIVRGLAQANGGQAGYRPNLPHGSRFVVLLPTDERSQ
jgi:signal transduction histidine kinase